jgi:hypothetical protein
MNNPSLFDFQEDLPASETVDEINQELLEKGKALFPDKFFIFGTGKTDAETVVVAGCRFGKAFYGSGRRAFNKDSRRNRA